MRPNPVDMSETVVPFAPVRAENVSKDHDPLDKAGQSILGLLQEAATTAKENCGRALRVAHGLSLQLRAAEDQIKALEADLRHFQDRAMRAENWLQRISREIEVRFFEPNDGPQQHAPARQNGPYFRKVRCSPDKQGGQEFCLNAHTEKNAMRMSIETLNAAYYREQRWNVSG
jgi:hypothetical protein